MKQNWVSLQEKGNFINNNIDWASVQIEKGDKLITVAKFDESKNCYMEAARTIQELFNLVKND